MLVFERTDILSAHEIKWKSKPRGIGGGFKVFYYGVDERRNGVGVILKENYICSIFRGEESV